eukprot:2670047-Rhodomonas_salina.2
MARPRAKAHRQQHLPISVPHLIVEGKSVLESNAALRKLDAVSGAVYQNHLAVALVEIHNAFDRTCWPQAPERIQKVLCNLQVRVSGDQSPGVDEGVVRPVCNHVQHALGFPCRVGDVDDISDCVGQGAQNPGLRPRLEDALAEILGDEGGGRAGEAHAAAEEHVRPELLRGRAEVVDRRALQSQQLEHLIHLRLVRALQRVQWQHVLGSTVLLRVPRCAVVTLLPARHHNPARAMDPARVLESGRPAVDLAELLGQRLQHRAEQLLEVVQTEPLVPVCLRHKQTVRLFFVVDSHRTWEYQDREADCHIRVSELGRVAGTVLA